MSSTQDIEKKVQELAEGIAKSAGVEIVQVQFRREAYGWVLRLLIDRPGGIRVDDCTAMSRELSDLLDVEDPIPGRYSLEVSSPGLDRPLVKPADFVRFAGSEVNLRTSQAVEGRRNFRGKLLGLENEQVRMEVDGKTTLVEWSLVESANLVPVIAGFSRNAGE